MANTIQSDSESQIAATGASVADVDINHRNFVKRSGSERNQQDRQRQQQQVQRQEQRQDQQHQVEGRKGGSIGTKPVHGYSYASCIICANDAVEFVSVGQCDHVICSLCALRLRVKSQDKTCVVCKQDMEFIVVYSVLAAGRHSHSGNGNGNRGRNDQSQSRSQSKSLKEGQGSQKDEEDQNSQQIQRGDQSHSQGHSQCQLKSFDSFGLFGVDAPVPGVDIDHMSSMLFVDCRAHFLELQKLRSIICPIRKCQEQFPSNTALLKHLSEKHPGFTMCKLCLDFRPLFIPEHQLMSPAQLKKHMNAPPGSMTGAMGDKTAGHAPCLFCNEHFFDAYQLYLHMKQEHQTCHLCPAKYQHRFYRDMEQLTGHFRSDHFVCEICDTSGTKA
jgi:hypothetical protein